MKWKDALKYCLNGVLEFAVVDFVFSGIAMLCVFIVYEIYTKIASFLH